MMKKILSMALLTLPIAAMANNFDGAELRVASEVWHVYDYGSFITTDTGADVRVTPSNNEDPDVLQLDLGTPGTVDNHLWDIDFYGDTIEMTFIDPNLSNPGSEYDYLTDRGFHFQDVNDSYPPITGVTVVSEFAPRGFDPSLIRFDQDNIYINLRGSNCRYNDCTSMISPTGLNNLITVHVEFNHGADTGVPSTDSDTVTTPLGLNPVAYDTYTEPAKETQAERDANLHIDKLFDSLEKYYPGDLTSRETSYKLNGYRLRYYPKNNVYIGVKNEHLWFYSADSKRMFDLWTVEYWMGEMANYP